MSDEMKRMADALESKLQSQGYVHPEANNTVSGSAYGVYTVYSETGNNVYTPSEQKDMYAAYEKVYGDDAAAGQRKSSEILCPVCKRKAVSICSCTDGDSMCSKGHVWYFQSNELIIGDPHED